MPSPRPLHFGPHTHVDGDVVGGDKIVYNYSTILRGPDELPTRYDGRVLNFFEYYVGTPERPAPFGGRAAELRALDAWLNDPAGPPYLLVTAPAGRGKSGLLAHWVTRLASAGEDGAPRVVFFPISVRFQTHAENVVFASLAARLAHLHGDKVAPLGDAQQYRGLFSDYARRPLPEGQRLVVVLDGLDEAGGWQPGADLFPLAPPPHLRVLVSARQLAGDLDGTAWLSRLGWERPGLARHLTLGGLDRDGVMETLKQYQAALAGLEVSPALVDRLHALSEGDPLLVRLYVEALAPAPGQPALSLDDLERQEPGLKAYFDRWLSEQQALWQEHDPLQTEIVPALLDACATALGPLNRADLLALAPDRFRSSHAITQAAAAVSRFIIGDGDRSGYVYSHPRLDEYFAGRLTRPERRAWQRRFLDYGRQTLADLTAGRLPPEEVSAYLLQYYGAHLDEAEAPAAEVYALVCEPWLRAHEWVTGSPAGFLDDTQRAWKRAEAEGGAGLGQQVRAALCLASVAAVGARIEPDLLAACAAAGVISPALGLVLARQKPDPGDRAHSLAVLSDHLPEAEREAALREALDVLSQSILGDDLYWLNEEVLLPVLSRLPAGLARRALPLVERGDEAGLQTLFAAVVQRLPPAEQAPLLAQALAAARALEEPFKRAAELWSLAPALAPAEREAAARDAADAARAMEKPASRAKMLGMVAAFAPEAERAALLQEAVAAAWQAPADQERVDVLVELAEQLPPAERDRLETELVAEYQRAIRAYDRMVKRAPTPSLNAAHMARVNLLHHYAPHLPEAVLRAELEGLDHLDEAVASSADVPSLRARALVALAQRRPSPEREQLLAGALAALNALHIAFLRVDVLYALIRALPAALAPAALGLVRKVQARTDRARLLANLAARLPAEERPPVLREALDAARAIEDQPARALSLAALARLLPEAQRLPLVEAALALLESMPPEALRPEHVEPLLELLLPEQWPRVLALAERMPQGYDAGRMLQTLAPHLPAELVPAALALARRLSLPDTLGETLLAFSPCLSGAEAAALLEEARQAAHEVPSASGVAEQLAAVAERWPAESRAAVLAEAEAALLNVNSPHQQAPVLARLARLAPPAEAERLFAAALDSLNMVNDSAVRADTLLALAPNLPPGLMPAALQAAEAITEDYDRMRALNDLAPLLPADLLPDALAAVRRLAYPYHRALGLAQLAPRLPPAERTAAVDEALAVADSLEDASLADGVRLAVAAALPPDKRAPWLARALRGARAEIIPAHRADRLFQIAALAGEPEARLHLSREGVAALADEPSALVGANVLTANLPHLPEAALGDVVPLLPRLALEGDDGVNIAATLAARWTFICQASGRDPLQALTGVLRGLARVPRPHMLPMLAALAPALAELGGHAAVEAAAQAVRQAGEWWS